MSYSKDIGRFIRTLRLRQTRIHDEVGRALHQSIQHGSEITAAPGQPVQTGNLINSWQVIRISPFKTQISTNVIYAPGIEDGVLYGPGGKVVTELVLRSEVGGFHSLKLTRAGFQDLVNSVVAVIP